MASGSSSLDQLTQLYKHVIEDVVRNMREEYLNEGMDTELLEELKQIWLSKLNSSGAVSRPSKPEIPARTKDTPTKNSQKQSILVQNSTLASSSTSSMTTPPPLISPPQAVTSSAPSSALQRVPSTVPRTLPTPVSLTPVNLGGAVSTAGHTSRVTAAAVSGGTGVTPAVNPFIPGLGMVNPTVGQMGQMGQFTQGMFPIQTPGGTVLVNLQTFMALNKLQQQQQQKQQPQQQQPQQQQQQQQASSAPQPGPPGAKKGKDVVQIDGLPPSVGVVATPTLGMIATPPKGMVATPSKPSKSKCKGKKSVNCDPIPVLESHSGSNSSGFHIPQLDGYGTGGKGGGAAAEESSSEDDSDVDDSSADDPGSTHSDDGSPLNSNDDIDSDVDDPEANDDFETQDVMVCQWEKVYRVKSKWKFLLKDGVMNLNGFDYVFHKVAGEADW